MFFMDMGYDVIQSKITYDDKVLSTLLINYPDMNLHPNLIFNATTIHVGISVPFSKMGNSRYNNYQYMNHRPVH